MGINWRDLLGQRADGSPTINGAHMGAMARAPEVPPQRAEGKTHTVLGQHFLEAIGAVHPNHGDPRHFWKEFGAYVIIGQTAQSKCLEANKI